MKLRTPLLSPYLLAFSTVLSLVGCAAGGIDGEVADVSEAADALAAEESTPRERAAGRRPPGGPDLLAALALSELELTDAQRTQVEALLFRDVPSPARRTGPPPGAAALAAAIRAGNVDEATLARSAPPPDHAAHQARMEASLEALHAVLSAAQRAELVAAAKERPMREGRGAPPAHGPPGGGHRVPMAPWLEELELDEEQAQRIEAALVAADLAPPDEDAVWAHRAEHTARREALLDAFARDDFDAEAIRPRAADRGPERFVRALAVVVPLLDPEQREALAVRIEAGPPGGPHGRGATPRP